MKVHLMSGSPQRTRVTCLQEQWEAVYSLALELSLTLQPVHEEQQIWVVVKESARDIDFLFEVGYLKFSSLRKRNCSHAATVCVRNGVGMSQACLHVLALRDSGGASWHFCGLAVCACCAVAANTQCLI